MHSIGIASIPVYKFLVKKNNGFKKKKNVKVLLNAIKTYYNIF